ncbi:MAG: hypothetical protein RLZZ383_1318 [Pseudomonadota bacterium]|jgi:hypothetical protein
MTAQRVMQAWLCVVVVCVFATILWPMDPGRIANAPPTGPERLAALQAHTGPASPALLVEIARATDPTDGRATLRLAALAEAHVAAPRDLDIGDALAEARMAFPEAAPPAPPPTLAWLTADEWGGLAGALWLVSSALVLGAAQRRSAAFWGVAATALSAFWLRATAEDPRGRIGVVGVADHGLRALPDLAEPPTAPIPVGSELVLLQPGLDFCRVRTGEGVEGWLPSDAITRATTP